MRERSLTMLTHRTMLLDRTRVLLVCDAKLSSSSENPELSDDKSGAKHAGLLQYGVLSISQAILGKDSS